MLHNLTDYENLSDHQNSTGKESWGNTNILRFLQGIRFHPQRKDGANITQHIVFSKKLLLLYWCFTKTQMQWLAYLIDTNFFDIVTGLLQEDTLASFVYTLLRLWTSNIHRSDENFILKNARSRYSTETMTDEDKTEYMCFKQKGAIL